MHHKHEARQEGERNGTTLIVPLDELIASICVLVFGVSLTTAHDHQQQAAEPIPGDTKSENTEVANEIKRSGVRKMWSGTWRLTDSTLEGDLNQDGFLSYPEIRTSLDKHP
uniref:Putative multiple coagulation factor deficiency 2-like protein n=1 Tax=Ixodes ricinus TaxID=34613 RepID=A0A0K8R598_IXORI